MESSKILEKASEMWRMLDELVTKSPQEYSELISSQIENLSPTPNVKLFTNIEDWRIGFGVKTIMRKAVIVISETDLNTNAIDYYINFYHSEKFPTTTEIKDQNAADNVIPIGLNKRQKSKATNSDSWAISDLLISTETFNRCLDDKEFRKYVIYLAIIKLQKQENELLLTQNLQFLSQKRSSDSLIIESNPNSLTFFPNHHFNNTNIHKNPVFSNLNPTIDKPLKPNNKKPLIEVLESSTFPEENENLITPNRIANNCATPAPTQNPRKEQPSITRESNHTIIKAYNFILDDKNPRLCLVLQPNSISSGDTLDAVYVGNTVYLTIFKASKRIISESFISPYPLINRKELNTWNAFNSVLTLGINLSVI